MLRKALPKPSEKNIYQICLAVILLFVGGLTLYGFFSGKIQTAALLGIGGGHTVALPSGVYVSSVFINLVEDINNSPLRIFTTAVLSTAVLVIFLIHLLILMIGRMWDYSKYLLMAIICLVIRVFDVDLAVGFDFLTQSGFSTALAFIFYGFSTLASFFLALTIEEQIDGKPTRKTMFIFVGYYAFLTGAIGLAIQHPETQFLEQYLRLAIFGPLFYDFGRMYRLVKEKRNHLIPATIAYTTILIGLFSDTVYLSGWSTADMFLLYPVALCIMLLCLTYINYQIVIEQREAEAVRQSNRYRELEQKSAETMISQIQPHFMFNTLQAIQVLMRKNPDQANQIIYSFSEYLRSNLEFVKINEPVAFEKAMVPVKCYLEIEKVRFKNRFDVVYEIGPTDFKVPPLCIQPLMENAVKHGVCRKQEGGTVWLRTLETEETYEIIIKDDGAGFNTKTLKDKTNGGLYNVRFQIEKMLGGSLAIGSTPGSGSVLRIIIPKNTNT